MYIYKKIHSGMHWFHVWGQSKGGGGEGEGGEGEGMSEAIIGTAWLLHSRAFHSHHLYRPTYSTLYACRALCTKHPPAPLKGLCHERDIFLIKVLKFKSVHSGMMVFQIILPLYCIWWKLIIKFLLASKIALSNSKTASLKKICVFIYICMSP